MDDYRKYLSVSYMNVGITSTMEENALIYLKKGR